MQNHNKIYILKNEKEKLLESLRNLDNKSEINSTLDRVSEIETELYNLDIIDAISPKVLKMLEVIYKDNTPKNVVDEILKVSKLCKKLGGELSSRQIVSEIICRLDKEISI